MVVLDLDIGKLRYIDSVHQGRITTLMSNTLTLEEQVQRADLLIGAVLVPGAKAPEVVTEDMVRSMKPGAVIVDISIDQGGCVATSHVTTHADPTYVQHGVVHYCVGNMPGAVPHTSTYALTNVTIPYAVRLADGMREAFSRDAGLAEGVNVAQAQVTNRGVADAHGLTYRPVASVLGPVGASRGAAGGQTGRPRCRSSGSTSTTSGSSAASPTTPCRPTDVTWGPTRRT